MQKPNSIRFAQMLLYFKLLLIIMNLGISIMALFVPSTRERFGFPHEVTGAYYVNLIFLLITIAAVFLTLRFIRMRQRIQAISASFAVLILTMAPLLQLAVGFAIVLLLFASKAYFSQSPSPNQPKPAEPAEPAEATETEESGEAAAVPEPRAPRTDPVVEIRAAGPEEAETVHAVMIAGFEDYRNSVPPSSALEETAESVREALEGGQGAAILYEDNKAVGSVRYEIDGEVLTFFRLAVIPSRRRRGYARRLIKWLEHLAVSKGLNAARCKVRQSVQNNMTMYQDMGYEIIDQELVVRPVGTVKAAVMEKKLGV